MITEMKDFILKNLKNTQSKNISVFCGAGISINSGLPTAYGLLKRIFDGVSADKYLNINDIIKELPFEAIVEIMIRYSENYDVLTLFADKSIPPNITHSFLVKLLFDNIVDKIYTTNFDLLFEKASNNLNRPNENQFQVIHTEHDFNDKKLNDDNVKLVKIHGSAHDIESMKITLKSIANKGQIEARSNVIKKVFDSKKPHKVVILGYSCSDFFDIIPAIQNISKSNTEIIFIQHSNNATTIRKINEIDKIVHVDNPFKKFDGYYIETNTSNFIRDWQKEVYNIDVVESITSYNWERSLDTLINELKEFKYKFLGTLCFYIGKYIKAIELYENAKGQLASNSNELPFIYNQLSLLYNIENNDELAEKYLDEANNLSQTQNNEFVLANTLEIKAEREIKKGNYEKALEYYNAEAKIRLSTRDELHLAKAYQGISLVYRYMNMIPLSKEYTQKALILAESVSDLWLLSDLYNNMGDLLSKETKYEDAKPFIGRAIDIKKKINDKRNLFNAYLSFGTVCKNNNEFDEAETYYKLANDIAVNNNFQECIPMINYQFAVLYVTPQRQDLTKVANYLDIALNEFEKLSDKLGVARCKSLFGQLCGHIRNLMLVNAKNKLEQKYPSEWNKIKHDNGVVKFNFSCKCGYEDDNFIDSKIQNIQSELSTLSSDLEQGLLFHQLAKLFEIKMKNYLFQAMDVFEKVSPVEAELITNKYSSNI